ncbi:MAG: V-type ATP synthase subunit B, partial [Marinobacterium sp.]
MTQLLVRYSRILEIVGDIVRVHVPAPDDGDVSAIGYGDLALIENTLDPDQPPYMAQVIQLDDDSVSLQVFSGTKGLSTKAGVRFLGHPMQVTFSPNILGRAFSGSGRPIDGGPALSEEARIDIDGPTVNPMRRILASRMIRTNVPMIDVFNSLV